MIKSIDIIDFEKDMKRRWYFPKELERISFAKSSTVQRMEVDSGSSILNEEYDECTPGLENSTALGACKLVIRRGRVLQAVLTEQETQYKTNCFDLVSLAEVSIRATEDSLRDAIIYGKQDTKESRKYRLRRRSDLGRKASKQSVCDVKELDGSTAIKRVYAKNMRRVSSYNDANLFNSQSFEKVQQNRQHDTEFAIPAHQIQKPVDGQSPRISPSRSK